MTKYIDTQGVKEMFGWKSRAMVSRVALQEKWEKLPGSRPRKYCRNNVLDYHLTRIHTDLARKQGHVFRGLLRHTNGYSKRCPVCNKEYSSRGIEDTSEGD